MQIEKKSETLGMKVTESVLATIQKIADEEDRPIGYVARELMLRGLALYEQDGKVRDPAPLRANGIKTVDVHLSEEPAAPVRQRKRG